MRKNLAFEENEGTVRDSLNDKLVNESEAKLEK
jgi:hypothetical protein